MEGDECKFAVWTGHYNGKNQASASESKVKTNLGDILATILQDQQGRVVIYV